MALLFVYLLIAVSFSFLCSVLEAVMLSITPTFIDIKSEEKKPFAKDLQKFKANIDRPLSAILTLNTFAHTIGAAGVGAQAQIIWGDEYLSIISAIVTIIILIFSEIIPKTIGAKYWRQLAGISTNIVKFLIYVLYPLVYVSQLITSLIKKEEGESVLSRRDIKVITELAERKGIFEKGESTIIRNLLRFNTILVKDIMTPRTVVVAEQEETAIKELYKKKNIQRFSRIPVYDNNFDDITGFVLKDEVLVKIIEKEDDLPLKSIKREIQTVFDQLPIPKLFEYLMKKNEHIALVVDEYGGMKGVVTIEDVVETLFGMEIMDETDSTEDMQALARKNWERRAKELGLIKGK